MGRQGKSVPDDFQVQVMRELSALTLVKAPSLEGFLDLHILTSGRVKPANEDLLSQLLEQSVKPKSQKNIVDAQKILKQRKVLEHLCPALQTASDDVFALAKIITPVLISLILAGTIAIPLSPILFAAISIVIGRMGVAGLCSEINHNIQSDQGTTRVHTKIEGIAVDNQRHLINIIEAKIRRLRVLERQEAFYGISCPPQLILEIEDIRKEIGILADKAKKGVNS